MRATKTRILLPLLLLACTVLGASSAPVKSGPDGRPLRDLLHAWFLPYRASRLAHPTAAADPADRMGSGFLRPWQVGIQAGHWKAEALPEELSRLRWSRGAQWRDLKERDVNVRIAAAVARQLSQAGIRAELLPATVPAGYRADAFVSIHCDIHVSEQVRGWKAAAPWKASEASRALLDAIARFYAPRTGIPEDRYGITSGMRGYYAFTSDAFRHAVATETPSVIVETGFLSSAEDRKVVVEDPERAARGISDGIIAFLRSGADRALPLPPAYPPMRVAARRAAVRSFPQDGEPVTAQIPRDTLVHPVAARDGWVEMVVWNDGEVFGWVKGTELRAADGG